MIRLPHSNTQCTTLIKLLSDRADGRCANHGFTFFRGDDQADEWLRYGQLDQHARKVASQLLAKSNGTSFPQAAYAPRVAILCPPGPSYLKALFGALYSGMIAVTAYPPRARRRDERLDAVIEDSGATFALVDATVYERRDQILKSSPALGNLQWINVDDLSPLATDTLPQQIGADDVAVLQYTSGSTRQPKGVCLTHRNLLANLKMIYEAFEIERFRDTWSVTWLPPYHDMGLIGGLLQVLYAGECSHVLPPASFVQQPIRWLRALMKYKATVSGGPNFAYDTCVERITEAERKTLDLSSWTLAFTGAEPIRSASLQRFADTFSHTGFQSTAFFPCYGLAEATLIVSGGPRSRATKVATPKTSTQDQDPIPRVSCGSIPAGQQVRVVDPEKLVPLADGSVGELWVAGDNISPGYWQQSDATNEVFYHSLPGESVRFLRTGDLGFLHEGEVYVSGRLKEMIILRGRNFHANDIEDALIGCDDLIIPNASAAFESESPDGSELIIVQEVERTDDARLIEVQHVIRARLVEAFDQAPDRVVLISKRKLPKTSSGKVKRSEAKQLYLGGKLKGLVDDAVVSESTEEIGDAAPVETPGSVDCDSAEVTHWIVQRLANQMHIDVKDVDVTRPFVQYGLDSVSAVQIASELEAMVGRQLPATLFYEAPTIAAVVEQLNLDSSPDVESKSDIVLASSTQSSNEIAIIGVSCRLPGCDSVDAFWGLLRKGDNAVIHPPSGREHCVNDYATTRRAGWITEPDRFDAALFGISPREARSIDPQHRLLLETTWRAIEDAGIDPLRLSGSKTGAYIGISNRDYERVTLNAGAELSTYSMTGNAASMAAHRLSYHLNLQGPSLAIDTACSSSLVALHQAVRGIQTGDCDSAVVAGVNLILSPEVSQTLSDADMLSPDGLCKTFDARANGYVRGEGCVAVMLKPLRDALRDGDPVRAVIRGTAVNQDGLTNGITAPNGDSQSRLYRAALSEASVDPSQITLLEAHGTGTPLGDPIEVRSLQSVYESTSSRDNACYLSAVKANVGHLEAAAGLASLLKVILQLQHRETTPQPNFNQLNPQIELRDSRLTIPQSPIPWSSSQPRFAAVSSFGFGGTNAHVIISESRYANSERAKPVHDDSVPSSIQSASLVTLSAFNAERLKEVAAAHARLVDDAKELHTIASATHQQKTSHRHRIAVVGETGERIANRLRQFALGESSKKFFSAVAPVDRDVSIGFMYSGQGGQYVGMGHELYSRSTTFRWWVDRCDELLEQEFGYGVGPVIASKPTQNGAVARILEGPGSQTSLFVFQLAMTEMLTEWGIRASCVLGHSMGEYAAAVFSGVMQWQDALRLTATRARHVASLDSNGSMSVVFDTPESVQNRLDTLNEDLTIAAVDGPRHTVVSGDRSGMAVLEQLLQREGIASSPLRITHAFHSHHMDPVLATIRQTVEAFKLSSPDTNFISTMTGGVVSQELCDVDYWMQQSRRPVQFVAGLESLQQAGCDVLIEIGPHPILCKLGQQNTSIKLDYRPTLTRGDDGWKSLLQAIADLYVRGVEVDWKAFDANRTGEHRVILPGYPFRRESFWVEEGRHEQTVGESENRGTRSLSDLVIADFVQSRKAIHTNAQQELGVSGDSDLQSYRRAMIQVDQWVAKYMLLAVDGVTSESGVGAVIDPRRLIERGELAPQHLRLMGQICKTLTQDGWLRQHGVGSWQLASPPSFSLEDLRQQTEQLLGDSFAAKHELRLVKRCGEALTAVLTGQVDPLTLLFPHGETRDLESLYRASPLASASNRLVAETAMAVSQVHARLKPTRRLRVLEVGAGTGGTTSAVLPALHPQIATYVFTDASPLLVADASSRFNHERVEYCHLDIERSPAAQGFEAGSFDLVIAANVLHSTKELRSTLVNISELLHPNGFLIALEGVRQERFLDLVFGLTDGWWRFSDLEWRADYPLIEESKWMEVLRACGFSNPAVMDYPVGEALAREYQTVLLAGAPSSGKTRVEQKRPEAREEPTTAHRHLPSSPDDDWLATFRTGGFDERRTLLESFLRQNVGAVLGSKPEALDIDQPVSNLGIDSLMAIQLKNQLERVLGLSVPMVAFLEGKSIRQLIDLALTSESGPDSKAGTSDIKEGITDTGPAASPSAADPQPVVLGPMSDGQRALWMIYQRSPKSPAYNFAFAARTRHRIDLAVMTTACRILLERHPVLRTLYRLEESQPVRVLSQSSEVQISERDCSGWDEERLVRWIRRQSDLPFDLENGPVIRFSLLRCDKTDVLAIAMHHIAADLWSMDTLVQELVKLYGGISKGEMIELDPLTATYDDYVRWEASLDHTESGKQLWAHWRDRLQDAPHTLALPTTRRRPNEQTFQGDSIEWTISPEVVALLRDLALSERTTMFTVLLTAYQVFLARICEQDDFLVGTISASRGQSEWEGVVGYFLNQLVLRTQINGSPSFRDVLRDSQREILDALEHQSFPFSKLVERIRPPRDASRPPLVQTMFIWDRPRNLSRESIAESDTGLVGMQPLLMEQRGAPFDLTLIVFDLDGQLKCKLRYNTDLFHPEVMESLSGSLQTLMEAVANDPDRQVRSVALLPNAQQEQLTDWNANDFPFEPQKSTCSLFQEWVRRTPNATAIESDDESLSYAEADQRSNSIARRLRDDRVASGDLVAILLPRGLDAIVTMLGVWKTGAAFLALDPNQPTARLQDMLADASPSALVTDASYAGHESLHFECRMHDFHDSQGSGHDFCVAGVDPNSPAYVIYTSGSTGRPKGVVLTHRGLANLASAQKLTFDITTEDRCLQFASLGFDASIFEITMAFHAGACLYVLDPEVTRSSAEQFVDTIRRCRVSVATLPPSLLATLPAENLPDLQTLIAAGEVCSAELVRKWGEDRRLFNAYGPTEATVWATIELCECDGREPTIGQPISNTHAYIVDQRMQPMPLGIPGELCLSGPGLAIEYKNMPAATASAFVPNPFEDRCDAVMYRSGDRARWTNDGRLEFLGRRDDQVKLDGYRIEPDEIASAIREWETIENAVVACRQIGTSMALVAYVVFDSPDDLKHSDDPDSDAELDALRRHLASRLPSYLLPKQFVILEQFPVNASGKVDIAALPMPDAIRQRVVAPRSVTEVALVEIWSEVLELDDIGIDDNFFDLGGASLQALQAADLVSNRGMPISAENLFQFQTIRELANAIDTSSEQTVADEYQCDVQNASLGDHESLGRSRSDENVNAIEHQQSTIDASLDDYRMVVESLGIHLPAEIVTTEQVVADCERKLDFPLERMTGIRSRRMAGRDEFSIDLARRAAQNCLANSRYEATELDLIIACNISRYDGPDFQISYEPSTASKLKQQIGASSAVAFDVCNACAGFFTALQIAESKLLAGEVRRVMIVSGEYITHLTKTAQREIDGFLDPRLPSLTLGDAGAAVIVELTDQNVGFDALKLYTSASHYDLCIAKATDQPHGGAVMLTKAIKAAAVTLEHLVGHAQRTVEARKWDADDVNHVIMHQTSSTTLDGAIEALNRHFGKTICDHNNTVNNLRDRANTASTTHWVAVMDLIRQGRIQTDDQVVFAISGSGQTVGTALYKFDDLPERVGNGHDSPEKERLPLPVPKRTFGVRIVAAATDSGATESNQQVFTEYRVVNSAIHATQVCLEAVGWKPNDVELLIHAGVYRDQFLSEPAVAAIVAGELKMNDRMPHDPARQTLAYDLSDAGRGSLAAMSVVASSIRMGRAKRGLVTASEIENEVADNLSRGVAEVGSAIALQVTDEVDKGFGDFFFRSYPQFSSALVTTTKLHQGRAVLAIERTEQLEDALVHSVQDCVSAFLDANAQSIDDYDRVLVSIPDTVSFDRLAAVLRMDADRLVTPVISFKGDAFTSGLAFMWQRLMEFERIDNQRWLLVAAGAGIEVGCVEYRH